MNRNFTLNNFSKAVFAALLFTGFLSAPHTAQATKGKSDKSSIANEIKALPTKLQAEFVNEMTLTDLLEINRGAEDLTKDVLQPGLALEDMIVTQFYQVIERLFTIQQNDDETWDIIDNDLSQEDLSFQLQSLMEVLRALYNHEYYKIYETAYDNIIADMKNNDLFINGALQAIYDSRSGLLLSKNVLGQILNQIDGEDRKIFPLRTDNFKESIKTIYNVLIEITMHTSNELTDGDWYISKPTHLKVILMESTSITDETKERLVSFIEQKPDLYSYPGGVLFYALKYPVQHEEIMVGLIKRGRDSYQDNAIIEYLKLEGSDTKPGVPLVILLDKKFENEDEKLQFYLDYLNLPDADPVTIAFISLYSKKIFKSSSHIMELIQAAANHPKIDIGMLRRMGINIMGAAASTLKWFNDLGTWFSGDSL